MYSISYDAAIILHDVGECSFLIGCMEIKQFQNCRESRDGHKNVKKYTNKGSRDNNKYKGRPYIIFFS